MSNRSVNLDFSKSPIAPVIIYGRVGDNGLQTITVHLSNFNEPMDLRDGVLAFEGLFPDGKTKVIDSEGITVNPEKLVEGTFEYTFPSAAFSVEGTYKRAYFSFQKEGKRNTSGDFKIIVLGNTDLAVEEAEAILTEYNKLIEQLHELYQQTTDKVTGEYDQFHQQITKKMNEMETVIQSANADLTALKTKVDEIKKIIEKLDNLSIMYSNSIDFGDYDYSGNANLLPKLTAENFTLGNGGVKVKDGEDGSIVFTLDGTTQLLRYNTTIQLPVLKNGKTYTISADIKFHEDLVGDVRNLSIRASFIPSGTAILYNERPIKDTSKNKWITLKGTNNIDYGSNVPTTFYMVFQDIVGGNRITGTISLRNFKIEEGSVATPYQPNLLGEPYHVSEVLLGENIANKGVQFPIKSSEYRVYNYKNAEDFIIGQKYVLTVKATKPGTQFFNVRNTAGYTFGNMTPVEGLTDTWTLTFTPSDVDVNNPSTLEIYQVPDSTKGAVQIDWLKLEKDGTRTPNIQRYKYRGIGMRDSNNPKDYVWDLTPEYLETNYAKDQEVKENSSNINMLIDSLRVVSANVAWMKSNTFVLGKWQDLPLAEGYQGGDGTTPKYRIDTIDGYKRLSFSGAVTTTSSTLPSQSQQHVVAKLPAELLPNTTAIGMGATSLFTVTCRLAVTSSGDLYIGNDSGKDVKYCYLDALSYWLD